jgi:hypothetical protein
VEILANILQANTDVVKENETEGQTPRHQELKEPTQVQFQTTSEYTMTLV